MLLWFFNSKQMNYYLDTEFLEGKQQKRFFGVPMLGMRFDKDEQLELYKLETKNTIDLISIGIVAEDEREYYAISKDFNLKEAWNRYQLETDNTVGARIGCLPTQKKVYWIRENVLKPIFEELVLKEFKEVDKYLERKFLFNMPETYAPVCGNYFTYKDLKKLIAKYGKTNEEIAEEVKDFCKVPNEQNNIEFYAYYADYDWVVFCWIFGKMIDLPQGFPMYCKDLKQILDEKANALKMYEGRDCWSNDPKRFMKGDLQKDDRLATLDEKLKGLKKNHPNYPKQTNEHNALADAKWNKELHSFLNKL